MAKISDFHGEVTKCFCSNPDEPVDCKQCFSRGYIAKCLGCDGTGQITIPVAGAGSGNMRSTCEKCGGTATFGVGKPADVVVEKELQTA